jgi:O-antigen ligase
MSFNKLVRCVALFWGLVVFMPVGVNYLAFFALILGMVVQTGRADRLRRFRQHLLFWPLVAYVAWTLIVLAFQPTLYAQTPSNLWHGARIALTLALALALTRDEAVWAMRGFAIAVMLSLTVIGLSHVIALPDWAIWSSMIQVTGNKSIGIDLLLTVAAGSAIVVALATRSNGSRALALALVGAVLVVVVGALPNRTSQLIVLLMPAAAAWHQWRQHRGRLLLIWAGLIMLSGGLVAGVPAIQNRLVEGWHNIQQAQTGVWSHESWGIRLQMYRNTAAMVVEQPLTGWGIGGWTSQWQQRAPAEFAGYNMPHNDYLWMGAQAGLPGALALLAILVAACVAGWKRRDATGRMAFLAALTVVFAAAVNSATRDANIGLSLLWVVGVYLCLVADAGFDFSMIRHPAPDA